MDKIRSFSEFVADIEGQTDDGKTNVCMGIDPASGESQTKTLVIGRDLYDELVERAQIASLKRRGAALEPIICKMTPDERLMLTDPPSGSEVELAPKDSLLDEYTHRPDRVFAAFIAEIGAINVDANLAVLTLKSDRGCFTEVVTERWLLINNAAPGMVYLVHSHGHPQAMHPDEFDRTYQRA